jgi:rubrerythrin
MDSFIKNEMAQREKIIKYRTSRNAEISEMLKTWKSGGIEILDDYLTLKQKVHPRLIEKIRTKWEQIVRPLNEPNGKIYSKHDLEEIQKKANKYYILLKFLEITIKENAAFFKRLAPQVFGHHLYADVEVN